MESAKVIGPKDCSSVSIGDQVVKLNNGEATVPLNVAQALVANHGFKFASAAVARDGKDKA